MAFSLGVGPVTGAITGSGTTLELELTGTTAGHALVVGVFWFRADDTAVLTSITCSGESDLTVHGSPYSPIASTGYKTQFASLAELTSGGDKTVTITVSAAVPSANRLVAYAMTVAGGDTANFFDKIATFSENTFSSPDICEIDIVTANDNSFIAALIEYTTDTSKTFVAGDGYTGITLTEGIGEQFGLYTLDAGSAGTKTVRTANTVSGIYSIVAAAFNVAPPPPVGDADIELLLHEADAAGFNDSTGDLEDDLLLHELEGEGYGDAVGEAEIDLLLHVLDTIGPIEGNADIDLLVHTISATHTAPTSDADISLLTHTISADGTGGHFANINLLRHTLSATGSSGVVGSASNTLLAHTSAAGGNHTAEIALLAPTLNGVGAVGNVGSAENTLALHTLATEVLATNHGEAANDLLYYQLSASASQQNIGSLEASLALHRLETEAFAGAVGTASISLLTYTTTTVVAADITGGASLALPGHFLHATGLQALAEAYRVWVLNLKTAALTEYDNFQFNSFAYFNGAYLAAGPNGIVVLGMQDLDDEDEIDARARTGSVDYGSTFLKRVPRLYVTGEFPGDMFFRSVTSEDGERTYLLPANGITGVQQRRVPIGKGPKSLQWQFELENIDGADFRLQRIQPYPQELRRRVA